MQRSRYLQPVDSTQARDLRLLDAQPASSPPAILCRDRAIVVNLEFIKCIVTTGAVDVTLPSRPTQAAETSPQPADLLYHVTLALRCV
jgi:hypothetical protein